MPPLLTPVANWVRGHPAIRRTAHAAVGAIPDLRWTVRVADLGRVRIRLRRHRWFLWEAFGEHDGPLFAAFERLIRPGDVVYDIGANIGVYARVMAQWFGASYVVAIEPMVDNFELLQENIALGDIRAVALHLAASDRTGEETLQVDDVTSGTAVLDSVAHGAPSAGRRSAGLPPRTESVRVERLALPPPAMIKIDTEGAEIQVLAGAERTLRAHRPRLSIALHGVDKAEGTLRLLTRLGYTCAGPVRDAPTAPPTWRELRPDDAQRLANNNIVAAFEAELVREPITTRPAGPRARG
jgi:FkbM family methyltransferase